jgi:hypothetical protein
MPTISNQSLDLLNLVLRNRYTIEHAIRIARISCEERTQAMHTERCNGARGLDSVIGETAGYASDFQRLGESLGHVLDYHDSAERN